MPYELTQHKLAAVGEVTESEGQLERFIHLFASAITIGEIFAHRSQAVRSPVILGAALLSLAIVWRKA